MTQKEIYDFLKTSLKRFQEEGLIQNGQNVAKFLIDALSWDIGMKINFYFAKVEQVKKVAKAQFNFNYCI